MSILTPNQTYVYEELIRLYQSVPEATFMIALDRLIAEHKSMAGFIVTAILIVILG